MCKIISVTREFNYKFICLIRQISAVAWRLYRRYNFSRPFHFQYLLFPVSISTLYVKKVEIKSEIPYTGHKRTNVSCSYSYKVSFNKKMVLLNRKYSYMSSGYVDRLSSMNAILIKPSMWTCMAHILYRFSLKYASRITSIPSVIE